MTTVEFTVKQCPVDGKTHSYTVEVESPTDLTLKPDREPIFYERIVNTSSFSSATVRVKNIDLRLVCPSTGKFFNATIAIPEGGTVRSVTPEVP
jgi:hypothetical protein